MFNSEVRKLLIQVITSWQVLTVTIVLIVYIFIVNSVARIYHSRPRQQVVRKAKSKPEKPESPKTPVSSETDELGLEEETSNE